MATPTKKNIDAYKGNDLSIIWDFTDANDDSAIDINSVYDAIDFKIFTFGNEASPEFSDSLAGTMSVTSTNKLSVSITDSEVDDLYGKTLYYKLIVTIGAVEKTFLVGDFKVYDYENGAQTDSGFTLSIDNTTQVTEIQTSGLYAEALTAVNDAQTAQAAAEAAQAAAETAETNAETAESNASASASSASTSASNASDDANDAEKQAQNTTSFTDSEGTTFTKGAKGYASDAETSKTNAENAETGAVNAKNAAETAETNAVTAKNAAQTAQTGAETAESNAQTSASNASTSETNAANSASAAATSETNAATSESNAATSESNAATSATNASDDADDAQKQAQNTTSFTDSNSVTYDKGAKGYAQDAASSANVKDRTEKGVPESTDNIGMQNDDGTFSRIDAIQMAEFANSAIDYEYPSLLLSPTRNLEEHPEITFTRASTKTYFDSDRVLKEASANELPVSFDPDTGERKGWLIEESRTNIFLNSDNPLSEPDSNYELFRATADFNSIISPDGLANGHKLVETSETGGHLLQFSDFPVEKYCFSVFAKAGERDHLALGLFVNGTNVQATFDLSNGAVTGFSNFKIPDSAGIENVGDGWYRCWIVSDDANSRVSIGIALNDGTVSYAGTEGNGLYVYGAQLEEGSFPTSYIPSELTFTSRASTATYFDENGVLQTASVDELRDNNHAYIDGEWVKTGPLLEGQSTNFVDEQDLRNWNSDSGTVVTLESSDPKFPNQNIYSITDNGSGNRIFESITSSGNGYVSSVFVKQQVGDPNLLLRQTNGESSQFNLSTGTVISGKGIIEDVGGGWFRCQIKDDGDGSGTLQIDMTDTETGDVIYLTGVQVEDNAIASSYIPTTTSQVTRSADVYSYAQTTRSADVATVEGTAFSDFYNQDEGTFVVVFNSVQENAGYRVLSINDGTTAERSVLFSNSGDDLFYQTIDGGSLQGNIDLGSITKDTIYKCSFSYKENEFKASINGVLKTEDDLGSLPTVDKMNIGSNLNGGNPFNGYIQFLGYYLKALTDAQIQQLNS